jgi:uncharacterized protein YecE (DUF72 family)
VIYIGTSGWQYRHWVHCFYPRKPRAPDELAYYAQRFATVELNGTFYRLPETATFEEWQRRTPDDFIFAMKASRFLTHIKRLRDPHEAVERMMARASKLGPKLGPVLLQLPPQLARDDGALDATLRELDGRARVAVEFRHPSWFEEGVRLVLQRHGAALCLADRGSRLITPLWRTAEWGYVRFHSGLGQPPGCYGDAALAARAQALADVYGDCDMYVYFNNDGFACALRDTARFSEACRAAGLATTRVAPPSDIRMDAKPAERRSRMPLAGP